MQYSFYRKSCRKVLYEILRCTYRLPCCLNDYGIFYVGIDLFKYDLNFDAYWIEVYYLPNDLNFDVYKWIICPKLSDYLLSSTGFYFNLTKPQSYGISTNRWLYADFEAKSHWLFSVNMHVLYMILYIYICSIVNVYSFLKFVRIEHNLEICSIIYNL